MIEIIGFQIYQNNRARFRGMPVDFQERLFVAIPGALL